MDLSTTFMGFVLPHPLLPGASPLCDDLDGVRRLEDAGAAAIVLRSLFEEQVLDAQAHAVEEHPPGGDPLSPPEDEDAPPLPAFVLGPDEYLEQVHRIKRAVELPVIASLSGTQPGWWLTYARLLEQAGADAIELNLYDVVADGHVTSEAVEQATVEVVRCVRSTVSVPVAVKLSPYYSSLAHLARRLDRAGAAALVLFNRFYQADIDVDALEVVRRIELSTPAELLLRLRWVAILSGSVEASLAVTGGVHRPVDVVKAFMAGAHAVQVVSALIEHGPGHLRTLVDGLAEWLERNEYDSLSEIQGSLSLRYCPDPRAFERANYLHVLHSRVVRGF
jgi:dihydroorotate dehydrogenase (fumarate)